MTDIARIGIQVDTGGVEKGVNALNKLQQAAAGVTTASARMSGTIQAANAGVASSTVSAAQAQLTNAEAILKRVRNQQSATKADRDAAVAARDAAKQQLKAALADQERANKLLQVATAQKAATAANRVAFAAGARVSTSGIAPSGPTLAVNNGLSNTTPRDMMPNRFNTANIAAQFQDIGVTAAMGMNPLIIAMQQGTQVAAIMNSMQSPLAGLAQAFRQILNPVSLLSIGLVGLVAAGLQMVDWAKFAQSALNTLADAIVSLAPTIAALAVVLAIFYSGPILAGIYAIITGIYAMAGAAISAGLAMAGAWLVALSPLQLILLAIVAVGAAFVAMGTSVTEIIKNVVGAIYGAYRAIVGSFGSLPAAMADIAIRSVNALVEYFNSGVNKIIEMVNRLLPQDRQITTVLDFKIENPYDGKAAAAGKIMGEEFDKGFKEGSAAVDKTVKVIGDAAASVAGKLRSMAGGIGTSAGGKTGADKKDPYAEIVAGANRRIESLKAEQAALGMTAEAAATLKYQTDLLNDATQKKIDLDVIDVATGRTRRETLEELGAEMARIEVQTKKNAEAMEFAKNATRGFFQDMKQGLIEGKSLWESFGNAVTNVLNRILDKMLETGVEGLFNGGGAGNLLSSLLSFGSSGGAPIPGGVGPSPGTNGIFASIAGAFGFAKGGAFTNGIVNKTTPFTFASGGAFGVMGEAGPEAIMPLHRGPDGSLGVKMAGGGNGGGTAVIININNNANAQVTTQQRQTSNGLEIDVMVDQMVSQKISDQGSDTNRSLQARDSRRLISR